MLPALTLDALHDVVADIRTPTAISDRSRVCLSDSDLSEPSRCRAEHTSKLP